MADRGRDLKFSVLSDADRFDLTQPARDLETLGRAAQDSGRDLGRFEDDTRQTARRVDDAFDRIARSSQSMSRKIDTETTDIRSNLRDVSSEAGSTAREAAASFSGSGDIGDAFQELAANAPAVLGPIGLAAGAAAAAGVGLIRAESEKLKELVGEMVDDMIESGGRLSTEFLNTRLQELSKDGTLEDLKTLAKDAGLAYGDLAYAKAGDTEATKRGNAAARDAEKVLLDLQDATGRLSAEDDIRLRAIRNVIQEYGGSAKAVQLAEEATRNYQDAAIASAGSVQESSITARDAWDDLRANLGRPIRAKVDVNLPDLVKVRQDLTRGIGTIDVRLRVRGQNVFSNTADNSRYRD